MSDDIAKEWLLCAAPVVFVVMLLAAAVFGSGNILGDTFLGVPEVWFIPLLLIAVLGVPFLAHFDANVRDRSCWLAIAACGLLSIAVFAVFHAKVGIVCTADPICPGTTAWASDTPFLSTPAGVPLTQGPGRAWDTPVFIDNRMLSAMYFSIVTFTTLGYGDFQPLPSARLLAGAEAIIGYLFLGMTVGALIDLGGRSLAEPPKPNQKVQNIPGARPDESVDPASAEQSAPPQNPKGKGGEDEQSE